MNDRGVVGKHGGRPFQERERGERLEVRGVAVEIDVVGRGRHGTVIRLALGGANRSAPPIGALSRSLPRVRPPPCAKQLAPKAEQLMVSFQWACLIVKSARQWRWGLARSKPARSARWASCARARGRENWWQPRTARARPRSPASVGRTARAQNKARASSH